MELNKFLSSCSTWLVIATIGVFALFVLLIYSAMALPSILGIAMSVITIITAPQYFECPFSTVSGFHSITHECDSPPEKIEKSWFIINDQDVMDDIFT
jgi:hypothetical protein